MIINMQRWSRKQNHSRASVNAGFSLVELLVVIAIMTILIGGAMIGVRILASGDAQKAQRATESVLSEVRTNTLSITGTWITRITKEDGSARVEIVKDGIVMSTSRFGSRIRIYYQDGEGVKTELDNEDIWDFSYMTSSGRFKAVTNQEGTSMKANDSVYGRIYFEGSSSVYILKLWYETGRITIEE